MPSPSLSSPSGNPARTWPRPRLSEYLCSSSSMLTWEYGESSESVQGTIIGACSWGHWHAQWTLLGLYSSTWCQTRVISGDCIPFFFCKALFQGPPPPPLYSLKQFPHVVILTRKCASVGWSIYAPAQLLVLYSRLHLINQNFRLQRWVLIMITSTIFLIIVPTWIVVWPAYNPDPRISSTWSPRDAIVERYNQIGK